jgi:outer membrane protein assembly factor BamB
MRLAFLVLMAVSIAACSWFGGDNEKRPSKLTPLVQKVDVQQRWQVSVGSGLSELYRIMPPVIDRNRVYANDYKGRVFAFDRETGKRQWQRDLAMNVASGVGVGGGLVLLASLEGDVVALDDTTGEERWRTNIISEILAPPQSNGSVVVVQTNDGKLLGLDAQTGKTLWTYTVQLPILTLRGTATPQVLGPNVVTGFANGKLVALSAVDGAPFWERRIARPQGRSDIERVVDIDGTPVISGQTIYATSYNGTLSALSPRGDILWSQTASSFSSPVVIDDRVFVTTAEGWVKSFNAQTGLALWENKLLSGRKLAAPQNLAGFLVTADYEGYVHVFDSDTGAILDRFQIDNSGVRSPMISDGIYLYVLGNDGVLSSIAVYLFKS